MEENGPRQCTATNKSGERCGRAPIVGGTVCNLHGGAAPQTIAAAERFIAMMREPALVSLRDDYLNNATCDSKERLMAIKMVLDRTGFGPHATLTLTTPANPLEGLSLDEKIAYGEQRIAVLQQHVAELRLERDGDLNSRILDAYTPEPIDAEIIKER